MDAIKLAAEALSPISDRGISVAQGWYDQNNRHTHITLWLLRYAPGESSYDGCECEYAQIQINIWSLQDEPEMRGEVIKLMRRAGFGFTEANDDKDPETGIFMNGMRFEINREASDDI